MVQLFGIAMKFTFADFTPAEVAQITTLSTEMQRDWRKRRLMPSRSATRSPEDKTKHNRYDVLEVAEIWIMKMFADRAIGPQVSKLFARQCAIAVVHNALKHGAKSVLFGVEWEKPAGEVGVDGWLPSTHEEKRGLLENEERQYAIAEDIARQIGWPEGRYTGMFIWWPTGDAEFTSIGEWESAQSGDARFLGPAIVLDLYMIGDALVERVSGPLVRLCEAFVNNGP